MLRIEELEQEIRDFVNDEDLYDLYFEDNLDDWNELCTSMDILGDTCHALYYFEDTGLGKESGEKYLKLYGFFSIYLFTTRCYKTNL